MKSRGCSCTSAVQPCSLETPAALLLYNMLSGAAHNCFPIHMCTTILMTNFPCSFTLGVALFSFLPSCVPNLFAQFSTIPPSPRPVDPAVITQGPLSTQIWMRLMRLVSPVECRFMFPIRWPLIDSIFMYAQMFLHLTFKSDPTTSPLSH